VNQNKQDEPIRIIVTGPVASGKTAILTLIAELLTHTAKFENVQVIYPEERPANMKDKAAALVAGKMDQVLSRPVVITECGPLKFDEQPDRGFTGHLRHTLGFQYYQWNDRKDLSHVDGDAVAPLRNPTAQAMLNEKFSQTPGLDTGGDTGVAGDANKDPGQLVLRQHEETRHMELVPENDSASITHVDEIKPNE